MPSTNKYDWRREPTINSRTLADEVNLTSQQRLHELVMGTHGRSAEQLDIWEAVFGPLGNNAISSPCGTAAPAMHRAVAQSWSDSTDILHYMQRNWTASTKLIGKLHVYVGSWDTYFLDRGTRAVEAWMKTTTNPHYEGFFHCLLEEPEAALLERNQSHHHAAPHRGIAQYYLPTIKPEATTTPWWNF